MLLKINDNAGDFAYSNYYLAVYKSCDNIFVWWGFLVGFSEVYSVVNLGFYFLEDESVSIQVSVF